MPRIIKTISKNGKVMGRPRAPRKGKRGVPSIFSPLHLNAVHDYACQGLTDGQICERLLISRDTFYGWLKTYPEFADKLNLGRKAGLTGLAYGAVLKALQGGIRKSSKTTHVKDKDGQIKEIRHEISDSEVWPCKETALKHLIATDPTYSKLKEGLDLAPILKGMDNIDALAEELRRQDALKQVEIDDK